MAGELRERATPQALPSRTWTQAWLRGVRSRARLDPPARPRRTASAVAAEWVAAELRELGAAEARIETEDAHGTFWWPLGLAAAAGRRRRARGSARPTVARRGCWRQPPARPPSTTCRPGAGACAPCFRSGRRTRSSPSSVPPTPSARSSWSPTTTRAHAGLLYQPGDPRGGRSAASRGSSAGSDTSPPLMAARSSAIPAAGRRRGALTGSRAPDAGRNALAALRRLAASRDIGAARTSRRARTTTPPAWWRCSRSRGPWWSGPPRACA